jgi:hypothetical protein
MKNETNSILNISNLDDADLDSVPLAKDPTLTFYELFEKLLRQKIFLKLHKNVTYVVDGRIIQFSNLIKQLISTMLTKLRITLENVHRDTLEKIIDFIEILQWRKEIFYFDIKSDELNNWYQKNIHEMDKIEELGKFLKMNHLFDYFNYRSRQLNKTNTFKTQVDIKKGELNLPQINSNSSIDYRDNGVIVIDNLNLEHDELFYKTKNFLEAYPPKFNPKKLSLELPIDISKIKKNANNSTSKVKFNSILKNSTLSQLIDALIADSFWFVVCFFQSINELARTRRDELVKQVTEILKRMSCNYFKFFINICDEGPSRKNDSVLNVFRDFMSQCVFYSLYLAFPKSRHIFNEDFRNRIISLFAYLYNGLNSQNPFSAQHWDLDLGKGNIIDNFNTNLSNKNKDSEKSIRLPDISDFDSLIQSHFKKSDTGIQKNESIHGVNKHKNITEKTATVTTTILNTPLYRLYTENNRFETLNMIKPIKFSHRKVIDVEM